MILRKTDNRAVAADPDAWLRGERALDVAPRFAPQVAGDWSRRLEFAPGRTLTAAALQTEQRQKDRRFALMGRALTPGVVKGLEVFAEPLGADDVRISVSTGIGLTSDGEDVSVEAPLSARLSTLPPARVIEDAGSPPRGAVILLLQPVRVLSAVEADPDDPCPADEDAYAYADMVTLDGARLVWWPFNVAPPAELPEAQLRNWIANAVFAEEMGESRLGRPPAWAEFGLPVALANVRDDGTLIYLDRSVVSRAGGGLEHLTPAVDIIGRMPLRRGRFDQFVEQIQTMRADGAALIPGSDNFRYLPPAGVLPPDVLNFDTAELGFFPDNYIVEAAPIPLPQFEAALSEALPLAPFDLTRRDYVELLVPVPEAVFEPRLLVTEEVDPLFDAEIDDSRDEVLDLEGRQAEMRGMADPVFRTVDPGAVPEFDVLVTPPEDLSPGITDFRLKATSILDRLSDKIADLDISEADKAGCRSDRLDPVGAPPQPGDFEGLKPKSARVSKQLEKSNDAVDLAFLRLQTDIYRARKNLMGSEDATRLTTSPIVATIASESATSVEAYDRIATYFSDYKETRRSSDTFSTAAFTIAAAPPTNARAVAPAAQPAASAGAASSRGPVSFFGATSVLGTAFSPPVLPPLTGVFATDRNVLVGQRATASSISIQSVLYGGTTPFRTLTIADRLVAPAAQEARRAAIATKAEIVSSIQKLDVHLDGLPAPVGLDGAISVPRARFDALEAAVQSEAPNPNSALAVAWSLIDEHSELQAGRDLYLVDVVRIRELSRTGDFSAAIRTALDGLLIRVADIAYQLSDGDLAAQILSGWFDPEPADPDEAAYFSAAVTALESAVNILRAVEGRLQSYEAWIGYLRDALITAYDLTEAWRSDLTAIEVDLDEARHDLDLAISLKAEEQERIDLINDRRRDVLAKNVHILGFIRPRTLNRFADAPATALYGEFRDPIPACLRSNETPPPELEEMLQHFHEAPLGWFSALAPLVDRLDRPSRLLSIFTFAQSRAALAVQAAPIQALVSQNVVATSSRLLGTTLSSRRSFAYGVQSTRATMDLAVLPTLSWRQLRDRAYADLSLNDLTGAAGAGAALAREAYAALERIEDVATCLYQQFRGVPADLRLKWAEMMSEHDEAQAEALDLELIRRLPGWGRTRATDEIEFNDWRALERLVGWLFDQVRDSSEPARSLINDLVRVTILLASHAPVSAIVEGAVKDTAPAAPGDVIEVAVGRGAARHGMTAIFAAGRAKGVVEDLAGATARIRVTQAASATVMLNAGEFVRFSQPSAAFFASSAVTVR